MKAFYPVVFSLVIFCSCSKNTSSGGSGVTPTPVQPNPVAEKPYSLVWSDEFNVDGLPDSTKWGYDIGGGGWGNNELQFYTKRAENAYVANGNLVIETKKERYESRNYTSARLLTKNKVGWTYGKFEIKAKIPRGIGTWPAIWLLSAHDPLKWPDDGELDIMEEVGFKPNVIYGTAHNKLYNGANGLQKGGYTTIADAQSSFHLYSIEWTENAITWSVDSTSFFTYTNSYGGDGWPYYKDFFMILNTAVGGNWGGQQGVDDTVFPQQMLIDYVRVYQRK
jgi:beta-glucanase (GH16 family)